MFILGLLLITVGSVLSASINHWELPMLRIAHQERGILTFSFDHSKSSSRSLELLSTTQAGFRPGWLHWRDSLLYSVSRTGYPNNLASSGGVFSFNKKAEDSGDLSLVISQSSHGMGGVFCDVTRDGRTLSVANIDGSTVAIYPLSSPGSIGDATFVFQYNLTHPGPGTNESQIQSNPHAAAFDPSGEYMIVPDRGADHVYVYHVDGPERVTQINNITLEPGTGPRHVTFREFNCTRTFMYLVSELDNTIRVFALDGVNNDSRGLRPHSSLRIALVQIVSTLGPGSNRSEPNNIDLAAEVVLSNDGIFAYVSNRNTVSYNTDTIAIYSVHPGELEHLVYIGNTPTYGKIPRHFSLSPDNRFIAVANEVSNNLIVLERDRTSGLVNSIVGNLTLGGFDLTQNKGPMAVVWDKNAKYHV
ncbi:Lactonase, 7-bladed beta-propeller domain-containing protein [Trichoderma sp. SZMC 28013]